MMAKGHLIDLRQVPRPPPLAPPRCCHPAAPNASQSHPARALRPTTCPPAAHTRYTLQSPHPLPPPPATCTSAAVERARAARATPHARPAPAGPPPAPALHPRGSRGPRTGRQPATCLTLPRLRKSGTGARRAGRGGARCCGRACLGCPEVRRRARILGPAHYRDRPGSRETGRLPGPVGSLETRHTCSRASRARAQRAMRKTACRKVGGRGGFLPRALAAAATAPAEGQGRRAARVSCDGG